MLLRDLRDAWRTLHRQPGYAALVVLTLALGIGPATAVWSALDAFILRPLPFPDPEDLVIVEKLRASQDGQFRRHATEISVAAFRDLYVRNRSFSTMACFMSLASYLGTSFNLGDVHPGDEPEHVIGTQVSDRFFDVLGIEPLYGRFFVPGEDQGGVPRVVVLSHRLFQRRFGGDPSVVGRTIQVNREPHRVIGVVPGGLEMPTPAELWVPLHSLVLATSRYDENMDVIARLKNGVSAAAAAAQMSAAALELQQRYPEVNAYKFGVRSLKSRFVPLLRRMTLVLMATVLMVLVIVCANVAHLAGSRAVRRQREMAVRAACGADRGRLVRQLLTENVMLAAGGALLGLVVAFVALRRFNAAVPFYLPEYLRASVDARVLLISLTVSVATGLAFGSMPARIAAWPELFPLLKEGGAEGGTASPLPSSQRRWRHGFLVLQATLTLVLLIAAGTLIREVGRLSHVDPGFVADDVISFRISISRPRYPHREQVALFIREILDRLGGIPGVENVGAASMLPIMDSPWFSSFQVGAGHEPTSVLYSVVSPGYFGSLGIPVLRGRVFSEEDKARGGPREETGDALPVIVVNESWAREYGSLVGDGDPLDQPIGVALHEGWARIIGVVGNVRQLGLDRSSRPQIYLCLEQYPDLEELYFFLKSGNPAPLGSPAAANLVTAARREVEGLDSLQPIYGVLPLGSVLGQWLLRYHLAAWLLGVLAALALTLSMVGMAGVVSYAVRRERHAMAVRIAMGAIPRQVMSETVGRMMRLVLVSLALGWVVSLAVLEWMSGLIDGLEAFDPVIYGGGVVLLGTTAWAACYVPARRITELEPMDMLRAE